MGFLFFIHGSDDENRLLGKERYGHGGAGGVRGGQLGGGDGNGLVHLHQLGQGRGKTCRGDDFRHKTGLGAKKMEPGKQATGGLLLGDEDLVFQLLHGKGFCLGQGTVRRQQRDQAVHLAGK